MDPFIRELATWLGQRHDDFVAQLHKDLEPMLSGVSDDGWPLCARLVDTLLWVPFADEPVENVLLWAGGQDRLEGFTADRYTEVARALVAAIRTLVGGQWSAPMGSSWISYFISIEQYLVAGSSRVESHPAVADADRARLREREARHRQEQIATGDIDLDSVSGALAEEEDDDEDVGYGHLMMSITLSARRENSELPSPVALPLLPFPAGSRKVGHL